MFNSIGMKIFVKDNKTGLYTIECYNPKNSNYTKLPIFDKKLNYVRIINE